MPSSGLDEDMNSNKRIVDYAEGCESGSSKRFGEFLNRITYSNGKIKPGPALAGLQISLLIGTTLAYVGDCSVKYIRNNLNNSKVPIERTNVDSTRSTPYKLQGYYLRK